MRTRILVIALCIPFIVAVADADNVTVHGTLGMLEAQLVDKDLSPVGTVEVWNDRNNMHVVVKPASGYLLSKVHVYLSTDPAPAYDADGEEVEPDYGEWPYQEKFMTATSEPYALEVPLSELKYLQWGPWGAPWLNQRLLTVAVKTELKSLDAKPVTLTAWALNPNVPMALQRTAWGDKSLAMVYELQHPSHGRFAGPVRGLGFSSGTHAGSTDVEGGFWYFPEEVVTFSIGDIPIGSATASSNVSPLDIFPGLEISDPAVIDMARLLISLDADGSRKGSISISVGSASALEQAMEYLEISEIDFSDADEMDDLIELAVDYGQTAGLPLVEADDDEALEWLEQAIGGSRVRKNVSKTPDYAVDKNKLDIIPVWVPAKTASGASTTVEYRDQDGTLIETRDQVKPLLVTYTQERDPHSDWGQRRGRDIYTAVSLDDGQSWKRFNISRMAWKSSFTLDTDERFPGDCRGPQQKISDGKILIVWTSAYARGGKPSFSIKTDDDYVFDDSYAVDDVWGVRGKQGSVDYDLDKDVGDQGIGEIPYYAVWACRGVLVTQAEHTAGKFLDTPVGEIVWFKPERLTSGRRDAYFVVAHRAKNVGFAAAWQEDPGGLLPGSCKGGGKGWSGATVHKKTDIWYSFIKWSDFDRVDANFVAKDHSDDEFGEDEHGQQPEISNRPKWLVPMSLPVRISDNNAVNTQNLKVQLDATTGLPLIDQNGSYIPLDGAEEADYVATEHEREGGCGDEEGDEDHEDHEGKSGNGGGWGMARYAYKLPTLGLADQSGGSGIWDQTVDGDYRPSSQLRWTRFINRPGYEKTVVVTADGRPLDGDTGACRPSLFVMPGGWVILGYEETKGLGVPPEGEHDDEDFDRPEPDDWGKNVIYHSFKLDKPDLVSGGNVLNLPALDDDGNLIPIFYKDAEGVSTTNFRQYKTENARRVRFITQSKGAIGSERIIMVAAYRQGREGSGKPADVFAIRGVVPPNDSGNPYRFGNLERFDTSTSNPDANGRPRYVRKHLNMSAATVESMDPVETASDGEGNSWKKVGKWKQYGTNLSDEFFRNPYSDAKAHRGFLRGDKLVLGYSFTPNWGRLGGDHMDFYVRKSFTGGRTWTTDPNATEDTIHTIIERDPNTGEFSQRQVKYGPGVFEPGRNMSLLKGNSHTVTDPRLVPPMGAGATLNPTFPQDDTKASGTYYVVFGTAKVLHGIGEPQGVPDTEKADIYYTRTTDGGTTWYRVPWVINPDSQSPGVGETVYRFDWLAKGTPHQGHAQIRMHPSGTRLYAIWHQWTDGDELHVSPHDIGDDVWFRRIDFMTAPDTNDDD